MKLSGNRKGYWALGAVLVGFVTLATLFQNCADQGFRALSSSEGSKDALSPSAPAPNLDITDETSWHLAWPAVTGQAPITYTVARTATYGSGYSELPGCVNLASTSCSDTTVSADST